MSIAIFHILSLAKILARAVHVRHHNPARILCAPPIVIFPAKPPLAVFTARSHCHCRSYVLLAHFTIPLCAKNWHFFRDSLLYVHVLPHCPCFRSFVGGRCGSAGTWLSLLHLKSKPRLRLRFFYPAFRNRKVGRVNLNPDEVPASLHASHAGCARAHERVEDGVAFVGA